MKVIGLLFALLFCWVPTASAQQAGGISFGPEGISIREVAERASDVHPQVLAARERITLAEGLRRQAGLRPNPSLEIDASTARILGDDDEGERSVGISQTFELGGKRRRRAEVAEASIQIASAVAEDTRRRVRAETVAACVEVIVAHRQLEVLDRQLVTVREFLRLTEARAREGEVAPLEADLLRVDLARQEAQRTLAQARLDRARAGLERLVPQDLKPLTIKDRVATGQLLVSEGDLRDRALTERPDLRAARLMTQQANAQVRLALAQRVPDLVGSISYRREIAAFENVLGTGQMLRDRDNLLAFGLSVPLPFGDRNQGNIQAAAASERASRLEAATLEAEVGRDVAASYAAFRAAERARRILEAEVVTPAQRNLEVIREAYRLGQLRLLDVLNEQRKTLDLELAQRDAERELVLAAGALEAAVGRSLGLLP